jgi:hypothetical protein
MRATANLVLDIAIGGAFLVAANPPLLGLAIHEWFGLAFAGAVVAHLVLHWDWIVAAARRLFARDGRGQRLNYAVDVFLFVALTAAVLSGVMISKHVLASLGLPSQPARAWRGIHSLASNASIAAMGVHLGLHWNWIALHVTRLVTVKPRRAGRESGRERQPPTAGASCPSAVR